MQLTRQQILTYLQQHRMASAVQLSHALQVTSANIRHHLNIMQEQKLVEVIGQAPGRGRGRPAYLYSLTPEALADNLENLVSALLHAFLRAEEDQVQARQIEKLAAHLIPQSAPPDASLRTRLEAAVEALNQQAYQARWEAHASGPRLILGHCPYATILDQHPELCQLDAALLARLLGQPVQQIARLQYGPQGIPHCIFRL
ncbi:MAG: ArsR family transcriptional regulator [Anaerolineales bacterium]|nr:ArsR family transcriptional regulator [Anaerolineales bacterium]